jgi:hypothetical protein
MSLRVLYLTLIRLIVSNGQYTASVVFGEATQNDEFSRLRPFSYEGTNIFLLCFSVDNRRSLQRALVEVRLAPTSCVH